MIDLDRDQAIMLAELARYVRTEWHLGRLRLPAGLDETRLAAAERVLRGHTVAASGQSGPIAWPDDDAWLTIEDATTGTATPARTLRRWATSGKVRARRAGRRSWLIDGGDLDRVLTEKGRR